MAENLDEVIDGVGGGRNDETGGDAAGDAGEYGGEMFTVETQKDPDMENKLYNLCNKIVFCCCIPLSVYSVAFAGDDVNVLILVGQPLNSLQQEGRVVKVETPGPHFRMLTK